MNPQPLRDRAGRTRPFVRRVPRVALVVAAALSGTALTLATAASASSSIPVPARIGQAPGVASGSVLLGSSSGTAPLSIDIELRPRDPAALAHYATAVSTPGSTVFGHYLARGSFASTFGPAPAAMSAMVRWLASEGLTGGSISSNHLTIHVTSTVEHLERALSIGIERYRLPSGRSAFANTSAPLFPAVVSPFVTGVVGLDDLTSSPSQIVPARSRAGALAGAPHVVTGGPQPCTAAVQASVSKHAYTADQLAAAYNFSGLYGKGDEGAGVTIALFELGPNLPSDITHYQACFGTSAPVSYITVDGGSGSGPGDGEAALDIETAIGIAPKAHFDVYQAPSSQTGIIDNFTEMIDNDAAQSITTSWGRCESQNGSTLLSAEGTLFEQAAVQGQSVFAATGDYGSTDCQTKALAVDDPASQPYVTGVGGTTLTSIGPAPAERVWNDSSIKTGAGGGGISSVHAMPSYQSNAPASLHVVSSRSSGTPCKAAVGSYCREVPDVSADSDRSTGYLIYYNGNWAPNGGTSAATPLWAAFAALVDASSGCGGRSIGFANPGLYAAAATHYATDFNDITSGNNDYSPDGNTSGLYPAGVGYDMATGLGTPNGSNLAATLCAMHASTSEPTTAALSLRKSRVTFGAESSEVFTVKITGKSGNGRPLGTADVFSGTLKLCGVSLRHLSSNASDGTCTLDNTALQGGSHSDLYAVYVPVVSSSTNVRFHYTASQSHPDKKLVVARDRTTTTVTFSPTSAVHGKESTAVFSVTVKTHYREQVPNGERVTVRAGTASCVVMLSGGKGGCSIGNAALAIGSYKVSARYGGDAGRDASQAAATTEFKVTS